MKRKTRSTSRLNRQLGVESLEQRQMLTVIADYGLAHDPTRVRVVENSYSRPIWPLRLNDDRLVSFQQPAHGAVEFTYPDDPSLNTRLTYTPNEDFTGVDSFEITTADSDGNHYTDTIWVDVTVSNYAIPDWLRVNPGNQHHRIDVLDNDHVVFHTGDPELENRLRIVSITSGIGHASISENGTSLLYQPPSGYVGLDTLSYTVEDALGNQSTAEVTVNITPDADANHYLSEGEFQNALLSTAVKRYEHEFGWPTSEFSAFWCGGRMSSSFIDTVFVRKLALGTSNVQVQGIDEGDIVETDGNYLYVASGSKLSIVDVRHAQAPSVVSQIEFDERIVGLYLDGDRLAIVADDAVGCRSPLHAVHQNQFALHVLDVQRPASPWRVSSTIIDGRYEDSRVTNGMLYLVSTSWIDEASPRSVNVAEAAGGEKWFNEDVERFVARFSDSISLPTMTSESGETVSSTPLATWENVLRTGSDPAEVFTSITTFDLAAQDEGAVDVDTFAGLVTEVYVSEEAIYVFDGNVANWRAISADETSVHKFEFVDGGMGVDFAASGAFEGTLLSQFAADEHDGLLRVAASVRGGVSNLHVIHQNGSKLDVVASLKNFAPGERIFASRFEDDRAFITTFRQVDPFFVIDLSDPLNPQIDGELKVPGFSNYLQVVDDEHVIGIGRTGLGRAEVELSLFNVSDPEKPVRLSTYSLGSNVTIPFAWNAAGDDHLAVTFLKEPGILALPVQRIGADATSSAFVLQVDTESGTISKLGETQFDDAITRTVHIRGHLFSLSTTTVYVTSLLDPEETITTVDLITPSPPRTDLNGDGQTTTIDVNMINSALIRESERTTVDVQNPWDVDNDGYLTGRDLLMVLNQVIRTSAQHVEDLSRSPSSPSTVEPLEPDAARSAIATDQQRPDDAGAGSNAFADIAQARFIVSSPSALQAIGTQQSTDRPWDSDRLRLADLVFQDIITTGDNGIYEIL